MSELGKQRLPFPFFGDVMPQLGDLVYIDLAGGAYDDHPEIDGGLVSFISSEHISVLYGHHAHKRFKISDCARIEVIARHP